MFYLNFNIDKFVKCFESNCVENMDVFARKVENISIKK